MRKIVLMYHDVFASSPQESGFPSKGACFYKVPADVFERQMQIIIEERKVDDVVLTFDDGGASFYNVIAPILEKYNLRGLFYVATDYIGTEGFMTCEQIKKLANRGHIIGSHSCSHNADMASMSAGERKGEWEESLKILADITGKSVISISIPNGYISYEDFPCFKQLGIREVYTSQIGENKTIEGIRSIGRYGIKKSLTEEQFRSVLKQGMFYQKERFIQGSVNAVKSILGQNVYGKIKSKIRKHQK